MFAESSARFYDSHQGKSREKTNSSIFLLRDMKNNYIIWVKNISPRALDSLWSYWCSTPNIPWTYRVEVKVDVPCCPSTSWYKPVSILVLTRRWKRTTRTQSQGLKYIGFTAPYKINITESETACPTILLVHREKIQTSLHQQSLLSKHVIL